MLECKEKPRHKLRLDKCLLQSRSRVRHQEIYRYLEVNLAWTPPPWPGDCAWCDLGLKLLPVVTLDWKWVLTQGQYTYFRSGSLALGQVVLDQGSSLQSCLFPFLMVAFLTLMWLTLIQISQHISDWFSLLQLNLTVVHLAAVIYLLLVWIQASSLISHTPSHITSCLDLAHLLGTRSRNYFST